MKYSILITLLLIQFSYAKNVLLICIDDLSPVMGCYNGQALSPNIDQFAKQASTFQRHYVQWPVCGPSRASMLGGVRPDTSGIYLIGDSYKITEKPQEAPVMPLHFKRNGYKTLSFGKIFHGKGWGKKYGWSEDPWQAKSGWTCYVDFEYKSTGKKNKKAPQWRPAMEIYDGPDEQHNDYQTATQVIQALHKNKDQKFFIAAGFWKPHLPFVAPKKYWDLYEGKELKMRHPMQLPKGAGDYMQHWSEMWSYGYSKGELFSADRIPTEEQNKNLLRAYYASVSFIDSQVGRILTELKNLGLDKNTAIVLWGDHGFHFGDHGRWGKHSQFENAMRAPLMIKLPDYAMEKNHYAPVESLDIYPTLTDYCQIPKPNHLEGKSLIPLIKGETNGDDYIAFSQIDPVDRKHNFAMAYSIRTHDYRYVEWRDSKNNFKLLKRELYKHKTDPNESINAALNPENKSLMDKLQQIILNNYTSLKNIKK